MQDEPSGHSMDGRPWEEARPPHLPDALMRLSPWLMPFLLLAGLEVVAGWLEWSVRWQPQDVSTAVSIIINRVPGVCAMLLGAALFWRRPDAYRTVPMIVLGVVLLATAALLRLASVPLADVFGELTPPSEELPVLVPLQVAYDIFVALVNIFALLYLARGLAAARRFVDAVSLRGLAIVLIGVSVATTVISILPFLGILDWSGVMLSLNVAWMTLGLIQMLAWSYLLVVARGGWLAGERPRIGWVLVAFAAALLVAFRVISALGDLLPPSREGAFVALQILGLASNAGWVLLLLAFVAGLPSIEAVPDKMNGGATLDPTAARSPGSGAG
jgi:hypothetical protein